MTPSEYASIWKPQSLKEAMFNIDTFNNDDAFWKWGKQRADELTALYGLNASTVSVDYGCGVGRVAKELPGAVYGIDASQEMVANATQVAPNAKILLGDGKSIPVASTSVDLVYSFLVLQHMHVEDVASVLKDIKRVLKPGGAYHLVFTGFGEPWETSQRQQWRSTHWTGAADGKSTCAGHCTIAYTPEIICRMMSEAPLETPIVKPWVFDFALDGKPMPYWLATGKKK